MKDNPSLPKREYYSLAQAAEELDCTQNYLIHLASLSKVKLITPPRELLCYRVRVIQWESGIKSVTVMNWTMMSMEFVVLEAAPLRLVERYGSIEISNISDEWPKNSSSLRRLLNKSNLWPPSQDKTTVMIDVSIPSYRSNGGRWKPPTDGERTGFVVTPNDLWVPGDEVERLKRGEPAEPVKAIPPEISTQIYQDPSPKRRNYYLRTIDALACALTASDLSQQKSAETVLAAISKAGIKEPIDAKTLSNYLKDARSLRDN